MSNDYITKKDILESLEEDYDQFSEQSGIADVFHEFFELKNIGWEEFNEEFDNAYKDKILNYLKNNVDEIADYANNIDED
jgi:hypothetical protein